MNSVSAQLEEISNYLGSFLGKLKVQNGASDFSLNKEAERLFVPLFNEVYELDLDNLESGNFPAIDLLDKEKRIAIQVTATADAKKIQDCLAKFYRHRLYEKADRVVFFFLQFDTKIARKNAEKWMNKARASFLAKAGSDVEEHAVPLLRLDAQKDICDIGTLYADIKNIKDTNKIARIACYLKMQMHIAVQMEKYYRRAGGLFLEPVLNDDKGMRLIDCYVDPRFEIHYGSLPQSEQERLLRYQRKFIDVHDDYNAGAFILDFIDKSIPLKLKQIPNVLLILGHPGQGKTSLFRRTIFDYIASDRRKACYLLTLRNIRDVRSLMADPLKTLHSEAILEVEYEIDLHEFKNSVLLLDGLDELYMRDNLKLQDIDTLITDLIMLGTRFPELRIIVTSRYGYVDDDTLHNQAITIIQLSVFSLEEQKCWLQRYMQIHPETWLTAEFLGSFRENSRLGYIGELCAQPLTLYMLASLTQAIEIDASRADVYDQLFTELISRKYSVYGKLHVFRNINEGHLRTLIREIAFAIHKSQFGYITRTQLLERKFARDFLDLIPETAFRDSIRGIMIAFYFSEIRKQEVDDHFDDTHNYAIEFLHRSLQEYMTAEKIVHALKAGLPSAAVVGELFEKELSQEIWGYICQILMGHPSVFTISLRRYLWEGLENLLAIDFSGCIDAGPGYTRKLVTLFKGYWTFLSFLMRTSKDSKIKVMYNFSRYLQLLNAEDGQVSALHLKNLHFSDYHIKNTLFKDCPLDNAQFEGIKFQGGAFDTCNLENVSFINCSFERFTFDEAKPGLIKFIKCQFNFVNFRHYQFKNPTFIDCRFEHSHFLNCIFDAGQISGTTFYETDFRMCTIVDSKFADMTISYSQFQDISFNAVIFENVTFSGVDIFRFRQLDEIKGVFHKCIFQDAFLPPEVKDWVVKHSVRSRFLNKKAV